MSSDSLPEIDPISIAETRTIVPLFINFKVPALKFERRLAFIFRPNAYQSVLSEVSQSIMALQSNLREHVVAPNPEGKMPEELKALGALTVENFEHWQAIVSDWKGSALKYIRELQTQLDEAKSRLRAVEDEVNAFRSKSDEEMPTESPGGTSRPAVSSHSVSGSQSDASTCEETVARREPTSSLLRYDAFVDPPKRITKPAAPAGNAGWWKGTSLFSTSRTVSRLRGSSRNPSTSIVPTDNDTAAKKYETSDAEHHTGEEQEKGDHDEQPRRKARSTSGSRLVRSVMRTRCW